MQPSRPLLAIAHRLHTVSHADRIYVLEGGRALESGRHDELLRKSGRYADLITMVKDRPGHDRRYAIDASKIERELGWRPKESFESGLRKTVDWYLGRGAKG